ALLMIWRKLAGKALRKAYQEPAVSLVIAMHNESRRVEAKIRNCFEMDYPQDKLQMIVSLDAPTDDTEELVRRFGGARVEVISASTRQGKAAALNRGVANATGQVVVFADAAQRFDRNAIRELVANFSDESVGAVSGELILLDENSKESSDGVGLYW